jgi:hypothetical protein
VKVAELAHKAAHNGGPKTRWTVEMVKDELRARFFREIETAAPEVLTHLKDRIWPDYRRVQIETDEQPTLPYFPLPAWPEPLQAAAVKLARDHCLVHHSKVPAWVLTQFEETLAYWALHPNMPERQSLSWGPSLGAYSGMQHIEDLALELPPRIERSIYETDGEFQTRVYRELDQIIRPQLKAISAKVAALPRAQQKRRPEHFTWLVLNQVRHEGFPRIAERWNVSELSVRNEITDLKREIGLSLPRGRH